MRIFTYSNPFEINKNDELWNIVTKHPHFCASDTLVQGLEAEYGRNKFGILRTVDSLINRVMGDYTNDPQNDIRMFLQVSDIIHALPDNNIKAAFRFNIADVVESVKFLTMLQCDNSKFHKNELCEEQRLLLDIYDQVQQSGCLTSLDDLKQYNKTDFIIAVHSTINDEIAYLCKRNPEYLKLGITLPIHTPKDGHEAITKIIVHLNKTIIKAPENVFEEPIFSAELDRANHILSLITNNDDTLFDRIIIHGVHKITPEKYFLFRLLEKIGIEIIFLINYAKNLPNVYQTWKDVYSWCDTKFEYESELDIISGKKIGVALADIIEGKKISMNLSEEVTAFSNLTSFTDREVMKTFKKAGESLNKMRTQYYAVSGETSNAILKMYFPEQFNQKPFLSYPIGQFILGMYKMWDFEKNTLILNDISLSECAVSNLYKGNELTNVFEIIIKTKLYFSDVETIADYYLRVNELEIALQTIELNQCYTPIKKLSFFSLTSKDLIAFKSFLEFIEEIANNLFKDVSLMVDFGKHFKNLMEIITVPSVNSEALSKTEHDLIKEITVKLNTCAEGQVEGNIQDVQKALCFYLADSKKGDTSNWIVRDFEQIDGAVLLSRNTKAKFYHFALLSNAHMMNQNDDVLPWPLTNDMFMGYTDAQSAVPIVTRGLLERRNFLKYSLFYGSFFTKCDIKLSYIQEENGEEQTLYYMLKLLEIKSKLYNECVTTSFKTPIVSAANNGNSGNGKLGKEEKEMFSICPYKFLQHVVLKAPIVYYNEYHIKYYVANFMTILIRGAFIQRGGGLETVINDEYKKICPLFPFWNKVVFLDIKKNTKKQIDGQDLTQSPDIFSQRSYQKRKENFLIAQWTDEKTNTKHMNFNKQDLGESVKEYMLTSQLYPSRNELPHKKICENCNFGGVCLRDYYEANAQIEGE